MLISSFSSTILTFLLGLDGIIYDFIRYVYSIFVFLTRINLFNGSEYEEIVKRIYIVLGVVMLFVLAYTLLKAIINPDDFSKGEKSFPNLIKNLVVSLIIIVILPTVFTVAFNVQNSIINYDVIPKLILTGNSGVDTSTLYTEGGSLIAYNTFSAFFGPDEGLHGNGLENCSSTDLNLYRECLENIKTEKFAWYKPWTYDNESKSLYEINNEVREGGSFALYSAFGASADNGEIKYMFGISTIVGIVLAFILLTYCIDLGLRVVKLVFYQIIAPIPIICRVMPDQKKIFDSWLKKTISTFLEALIRIIIMYLGVYLIALIVNNKANIFAETSLGPTQQALVVVFLIVGVVLFIKQAPGLLKDIFGFDLGLDKSGWATMFGLGATVGAGGLGAIRNASAAIKGGKGKNPFATAKNAITSGIAGGASSAARTAKNTWSAKSLGDVKSGASKGVADAAASKVKRATYRAKHGDSFGGVISGRIEDFGTWLAGAGTQELDRIISVASDLSKENDNFRGAIEKQFNKKITDAGLVTKMNYEVLADGTIKADFKGSTPGEVRRLQELYEGYAGQSFATIKQDIEQRREIAKNTDYMKQAAERIGDKLDSETVDAYQTRIKTEAQRLSMEASREVGLLDSMYNQLWKKSITDAGDLILKGENVSTISAADAYDAKAIGEALVEKIKSSGLPTMDPAKGETYSEDKEHMAKYLDDVASGAKNQASNAMREKQKYLEKNEKK